MLLDWTATVVWTVDRDRALFDYSLRACGALNLEANQIPSFLSLRVWTACLPRRRPPSLSTQVTAQKIVGILGILSDWMPAFVPASRKEPQREESEWRRGRRQGSEHGSREGGGGGGGRI